MKNLYFTVMYIFRWMPRLPIYQWAYKKCLKSYMADDPDIGYWLFAEDYFRTFAKDNRARAIN